MKTPARQREQQAQKHHGRKGFGKLRNLGKAGVAGTDCVNYGASLDKIANVAGDRSIKTL